MKGPDPHATLRRAAKSLGAALRNRRMYPPGSPAIAAGLERAHEELLRAMDGSPLTLDVVPNSLLVPVPGGDPVRLQEEELARRLHQARVGRIRLDADLEAGALADLLATLLDDEEEPVAVGRRLMDGAVAGVDVELLDLEHLFTPGGSEAGVGDQIWSRVLDAFHGHAGTDADGGRLTGNPGAVVDLLSWLVDAESLPGTLHGYSRVDLLSLVMEQIASTSDEGTGTVIDSLQGALRTIFAKADPETWLQVLAEPLPVEIGRGDESVTVDLSVIAARAFSAVQIEELVRYGVGSRPNATPRLYRLFDGILGTRPDRESIIRRLSENMVPGFDGSWPALLEVLKGENPAPYFATDYRAALERPTPESRDLWDLPALHRRRDELEPAAIRVRKGRVALSILSRERDPDEYREVLQALETSVPAILERRELELLDEIVSTLDRHRSGSGRGAVIRELADAALARLQEPETIDVLLGLRGGEDGERFHLLWAVLDRLGSDCLPRLLDFMEDNPGRSGHAEHLRHILADMPTLPLDLLCERIREAGGPFARQLILALSGTGRDGCLPAFRAGVEHPDPGVRRAAVISLAHLPVDSVDVLLLQALSDPVLDVRVAALRTFRSVMRGGEDERLRRYLTLSNRTGRNTSIIVAAIHAAEILGATRLLPLLEQLGRRPWIFARARRRPVWLAARRAAARIRATARNRAAQAVEEPVSARRAA